MEVKETLRRGIIGGRKKTNSCQLSIDRSNRSITWLESFFFSSVLTPPLLRDLSTARVVSRLFVFRYPCRCRFEVYKGHRAVERNTCRIKTKMKVLHYHQDGNGNIQIARRDIFTFVSIVVSDDAGILYCSVGHNCSPQNWRLTRRSFIHSLLLYVRQGN